MVLIRAATGTSWFYSVADIFTHTIKTYMSRLKLYRYTASHHETFSKTAFLQQLLKTNSLECHYHINYKNLSSLDKTENSFASCVSFFTWTNHSILLYRWVINNSHGLTSNSQVPLLSQCLHNWKKKTPVTGRVWHNRRIKTPVTGRVWHNRRKKTPVTGQVWHNRRKKTPVTGQVWHNWRKKTPVTGRVCQS